MPLSHMPPANEHFPILFDADSSTNWKAVTLMRREICMLKLIEDITNKPDWWEKIRNPEIAAKWKNEALQFEWADYSEYADFSEAMADAVSGWP